MPKSVGHLVETEIVTESKTLLIGLRQQGGGAADEYHYTITDCLSSVEKSVPQISSSVHLKSTVQLIENWERVLRKSLIVFVAQCTHLTERQLNAKKSCHVI